MTASAWLDTSLVMTGVQAESAEELVALVSDRMAEVAGLDVAATRAALRDALRIEGWSLGAGVGVPHAELAGIEHAVVCLVVTSAPIELPSIDGRALDVFFFILAPPDAPEAHLLLLAQIARLAQSRTLVEGLRRAGSADEASALVRAAQLRHAPARSPSLSSDRVLLSIVIAGEQAVDALLVHLLDRGFGDATILEAQSVREASTTEVPLFVGLDDIFGDPGGRRVILLHANTDEADEIVAAVQRIAQEHSAQAARVSVVPLREHWVMAEPRTTGAGHE